MNTHFTFAEYQAQACKTAVYEDANRGTRIAIAYCALKLGGEAGEVQQKIGKALFRHDPGKQATLREDIKKELGGVLWYVSQLALEFQIPLEEIAISNLEQLADRHARGVIKGSGDDR